MDIREPFEYASSSPCSSPALPSSSPASSPPPLDLDDDSFVHPLAASFHRLSKPQKRTTAEDFSDDEGPSTSKKPRYCPTTASLEEEQIWRAESDRAYESGSRIFQLVNKKLTYISTEFIADLKNMVVLPDPDATPAPSRTNSRHLIESQGTRTVGERVRSTFSRVESKNSIIAPGVKDHEIHFFLGQNMITKLPKELWTLDNLTVLSLRNNGITYLPPEIGRLTHLRDLNVATNKLKYLPSELTTLPELKDLSAHPNPLFLPEPETGSLISETNFLWESPVPTLFELASRRLGAVEPADLPRDPWDLLGTCMPHVLGIVDACAPGYLAKNTVPEEDGARLSRCANPQHVGSFVNHAEERYTWDNRVGNAQTNGRVPLLWRGCSRGCLEFLEEEMEARTREMKEEARFSPVALGNSLALEFDGDG